MERKQLHKTTVKAAIASGLQRHQPQRNGVERHCVERRCAGCGAKRPASTLLRLASQNGAAPVLDKARRAAGRGAYLCRQASCVERAWSQRAVERSLKLKAGAPAALKIEILLVLANVELSP